MAAMDPDPADDDDPRRALSAIQGRARKRAVLRGIQTAAGVIPTLIAWAVLTPFFGWLPAGALGALVGAGIVILIQKRFGSFD
jgi:hypothetical protein